MIKFEIKVLNGSAAKKHVDPFYKLNHKSHEARPSDTFFTAFEGNQCIGTVRYCVEENTSLLRSMLIEEKLRGQGIGKILLEEFQSYLINRNIENTFCIAYEHLDNFYGHIDFQKIEPANAPEFLYNRYLSYLQDYPKNSYIMMKRKGR